MGLEIGPLRLSRFYLQRLDQLPEAPESKWMTVAELPAASFESFKYPLTVTYNEEQGFDRLESHSCWCDLHVASDGSDHVQIFD